MDALQVVCIAVCCADHLDRHQLATGPVARLVHRAIRATACGGVGGDRPAQTDMQVMCGVAALCTDDISTEGSVGVADAGWARWHYYCKAGPGSAAGQRQAGRQQAAMFAGPTTHPEAR